jgi:DNA-binding MarR family transcriptional regulator
MTPEQWTVMIYLWEKDGVTQQELCNATFKDKPSMTRLIDNMERQHLVVRISDKKDRRNNLIHLTKTGKDIEPQARIVVSKTLKEALQGIEVKDLQISQDVLKKIFLNIKD